MFYWGVPMFSIVGFGHPATRFRAALSGVILWAVLACGGGGSPRAATEVAVPFSLASPSLSMEIGQAGTETVTLTRASGFTDAVACSVVASTLPAGVKAAFATASTTGTTAELTVQAGYPDPADVTGQTRVLPSAGTFSITLRGVSGSTTASATLHLTLTSPTRAFAVSWVDTSNTLDDREVISLAKGSSVTLNFAPYNTNTLVSYAAGTAAALAATGLPAGLTAAFADNPAELDNVTTATLTAAPTLADGTYAFYLTGTVGTSVAYLPVEVIVSSAAFWIQAPAAVSVVKGGTLKVPVSLGHNGTYFQDAGGDDPVYLGTTVLSAGPVSGLPASFDTPSSTSLGSANLTIDATAAALGTYALPLKATRTQGTAVTSTANLEVTVTDPAGPATYWLEDLEWGQTVLRSGLPLVPGKPALLAARILADRAGIGAPAFTATLKNAAGSTLDTLTLSGPAALPTAVAEGDLASAYTTAVPAADLVAGMTVVISGGALSRTLTPMVDGTGYQLNLVLVPVVHQGTAPVLPAAAGIASAIKAVWPVKTVATSQRAAYTTSTVVATPPAKGSTATDTSYYGWAEVLDELVALRAVDGSAASYFGFIDLGLPSSWTGSSIVGLHLQGQGVGLGIDATTGARFGAGQDVAAMVHEIGHGFNLSHTPGGGAGTPQLNYPYSGGGIGTWGYDPATSTSYAPSTYADLMSYLDTVWVSDWNYLAAMTFIDSIGARGGAVVSASATAATRTLVSGWISPGGEIHLSPTELVSGPAIVPRAGTHELTVTRASGATTVQFGARRTQDLPEGFRHFAFTLDGTAEIQSLELRPASGAALRRAPREAAAARRTALASEVASGALVASESGSRLKLKWDAAANPYATVLHVGDATTALAIRLTGGTASLSLAEVPSGGYFLVRLSDGLNPIEVRVARP